MATDSSPHRSSRVTTDLRRPLPHRLRLLFVGPGEPPWALLALRLESGGCAQAEFDWETDGATAMARLRKATFDCVIVLGHAAQSPQTSARAGDAPAEVRFVEGLRGSGSDDPIVVIMPTPDDQYTAQLEDLDCELLVSRAGWQSRALVALIRRAVVRGDLRREVSGLEVTARRQRLREREEAEARLQQLREMVAQRRPDAHQQPAESLRSRRSHLIDRIEEFYQQLLQTYVMMGSGNLAAQVQQLAELLSLAGLPPVEALALHVAQVDALLQGLGNRSSRHVMARADLLALDLMMQLADLRRQTSCVRGLGDAGVDLMHAETLLQRTADRTP